MLQAELVAIREAMEHIKRNSYRYGDCAILSDSMSALLGICQLEQMTETVGRTIDIWREVKRNTKVT